MQPIPLRTTVIGSYPFPGWLEFAVKNLHEFGNADKEEMIEDAVIAAIHDQDLGNAQKEDHIELDPRW